MIGYKLTSSNMRTYNDTLWAIGVERTASGGGKLCSNGWLHCYDSPEMSIAMNPVHGRFDATTMRMFECECNGETLSDHGLKRGYTSITPIREIPRSEWPTVTTAQSVDFGIRSAMEVYKGTKWAQWAEGWLDGRDRSADAARAAADAARAAADAAYAAANATANAAANAAAYAAYAAAAAGTAAAVRAAYAAAAVRAAYAAAGAAAAEAAAYAADAAEAGVDFTDCLRKALEAAG